MRKLVLFIHTSLDGFAASLNRELDWIHIGEEFLIMPKAIRNRQILPYMDG